MRDAKILKLKNLLAANHGIVKTKTLNMNGFFGSDIMDLTFLGLIEQLWKGCYIDTQREISDLAFAAKLIPRGVLCLLTAADYHELAVAAPTEVYVALPRHVICPTLPPNCSIKICHMAKSHFEAGITEAEINGLAVRVFDAEKTVCDCFKHHQKVDKTIALKVLKNYFAKGGCNTQKLLEYAKLLGKKKAIYPYVEALM